MRFFFLLWLNLEDWTPSWSFNAKARAFSSHGNWDFNRLTCHFFFFFLFLWVLCGAEPVAIDFEFEIRRTGQSLRFLQRRRVRGGDLLVLDGYANIPKFLLERRESRGPPAPRCYSHRRHCNRPGACECHCDLRQRRCGWGAATTKAGGAKGRRRHGRKGASAKVTYEADAVIVTVPLGSAQGGGYLFNPPLSAQKQGAIGAARVWVRVKSGCFYETDSGTLLLMSMGSTTPTCQLSAGASQTGVTWHTPRPVSSPGVCPRKYAKSMGANSSGLVRRSRQDSSHVPDAKLPENQPLATWAQDW